jgi:hypothetical protein
MEEVKFKCEIVPSDGRPLNGQEAPDYLLGSENEPGGTANEHASAGYEEEWLNDELELIGSALLELDGSETGTTGQFVGRVRTVRRDWAGGTGRGVSGPRAGH